MKPKEKLSGVRGAGGTGVVLEPLFTSAPGPAMISHEVFDLRADGGGVGGEPAEPQGL